MSEKGLTHLINCDLMKITLVRGSIFYFIGWWGRAGKAIALDAEDVRSNPREAQKVFKNRFEYFSATLSQVCTQHDELGRLVTGFTARMLCQVSWLRITHAGKAKAKRWEWPVPYLL